MLVLTRRVGESVVIGDDWVVTVSKVDRRDARLRVERREQKSPSPTHQQAPPLEATVVLELNKTATLATDLCIRLVELRPDRVRLGFEVPHEIPVYRQELYEANQQARQAVNDADDPSATSLPSPEPT